MAQSSEGEPGVKCVRITMSAGVAFVAIGVAACVVAAQAIGSLDLTDLHPRDRIRAPHNVSGECAGSLRTSENEITITLVSLDKASYSLGEEVTYEVKIQNSGKEAVEIPWTPNPGDLEPADVLAPYTFLRATVSLTFTAADSNRNFSIYANSYGSLERPGSTRKLLPGEWIFVRARAEIESYEEWWWTKIRDSSPANVKASAGLMLDKVTYAPGENGETGTDHSVCIAVHTKLGEPLDVALWPAKLK